MAKQTLSKIYSDIDFTFTRTPGKNDIALSYDEMAVIRSVRYLILTKNFERPFQPNLGSRLTSLLFEPIDSLTASSIQNEIQTTIANFEPRVTIDYINVSENPDENSYSVTISFFIGNNTQPTAFNLTLERTR